METILYPITIKHKVVMYPGSRQWRGYYLYISKSV